MSSHAKANISVQWWTCVASASGSRMLVADSSGVCSVLLHSRLTNEMN